MNVLTMSGLVFLNFAMNPTIENTVILANSDVMEFVQQTMTEFARLLYRGLL